VTLLAFAAGRRAAVRRCCWAPAVQQSIDISCPPGPQQQTHRALLQLSIAGTDRPSGGRTPYRYIDPAAYYASSVNNRANKIRNKNAVTSQQKKIRSHHQTAHFVK